MIESSHVSNLTFTSARLVAREHRKTLGDITFTFGERNFYGTFDEIIFMRECLNEALCDFQISLYEELNDYLCSINMGPAFSRIYVHPCVDCGIPTSALDSSYSICFKCDQQREKNNPELVS